MRGPDRTGDTLVIQGHGLGGHLVKGPGRVVALRLHPGLGSSSPAGSEVPARLAASDSDCRIFNQVHKAQG